MTVGNLAVKAPTDFGNGKKLSVDSLPLNAQYAEHAAEAAEAATLFVEIARVDVMLKCAGNKDIITHIHFRTFVLLESTGFG